MPVALLVPQKQILAVRRVDVGPVRRGLLDRRHRRVLVPRERDAELASRATTGTSSADRSTETVRARSAGRASRGAACPRRRPPPCRRRARGARRRSPRCWSPPPARKLTLTMFTTCCAWSAAARALARLRSPLATASRAARTSERAGVIAPARSRAPRPRAAWRCDLRPRALAAVEDRHVHLQQEPPAVLPARRTATGYVVDGWKTRSSDGQPVLRAVAEHAFGAPAARRRTASDRCAKQRRRRSRCMSRRDRVRRHGEDRLVGRIHRAVGDEQHAERLLRAIHAPRRADLDQPLVGRQLLLRAQRVQPAARALLVRARVARSKCARATSRARSVGLDHAPPRDDRQVRVGRRERDLPAWCRPRSARRRASCRPPARAAPSAPARDRLAARRATPSPGFCGVTVEPSNSTPRLSVVVVTLPFTCSRVADRACRISSPRRAECPPRRSPRRSGSSRWRARSPRRT